VLPKLYKNPFASSEQRGNLSEKKNYNFTFLQTRRKMPSGLTDKISNLHSSYRLTYPFIPIETF